MKSHIGLAHFRADSQVGISQKLLRITRVVLRITRVVHEYEEVQRPTRLYYLCIFARASGCAPLRDAAR